MRAGRVSEINRKVNIDLPNFDFAEPDRSGIDALMADVSTCTEMLLKDSDNGCLRRVYARSIFTMVEGATDYMKRFTHDFTAKLLVPARVSLGILHTQCPIPIIRDSMDIDELSLLRDERREVSNDGTTRMRAVYPDFKANIRFAINAFGRVFQLSIPPNLYAEPGWSKLLEGEQIRNRITHPKTIASIDISDKELEILRDGGQWIYDTYGRFLTEAATSLQKAQADLEAWVAQLEEPIANLVAELFARSQKGYSLIKNTP